MKIKTENLTLNGIFAGTGHLPLLLFFLSAAISLSTSAASEQLDPTELLESDSRQASADANMQTIPTQTAKLQAAPQKPTQSMSTVSVSFASQLDQKLSQSNPAAADPNDSLGYRLRQTRITALIDDSDKKAKSELQRIIEQIRAAEFESQNKQSEPIAVTEPASEPEPNEILSTTETVQEQNEQKNESEPEIQAEETNPSSPYKSITSRTIQIVSELSQHPEQVSNPFELAEILFQNNHLKEAAVLYQQALTKTNKQDAASASDRAWILFQIGNCLQKDDPQTTIKTYRQLINEYPDSPWTEFAKAKEKLTDWYQKDSPKTVIKENKP